MGVDLFVLPIRTFYKEGRKRQTSQQVELLSNHVERIIFKLGWNDWVTGMNRISRTGAIADNLEGEADLLSSIFCKERSQLVGGCQVLGLARHYTRYLRCPDYAE